MDIYVCKLYNEYKELNDFYWRKFYNEKVYYHSLDYSLYVYIFFMPDEY